MCMEDQVTAICKATHFHLRNIGRIRKCITYDACEKLIHALVTSRLDCGNGNLYGLPISQNYRLQRILNIAARILTLSWPSCDITPILIELHWLPIEKRIEYKLLLITFKAKHDLAPQYICDLLKPYPTPRQLRSSNENFLAIPQSRTKSYGDRAFSVAAPKLWNGLPEELRFINELEHFKRKLKTHLFNSAYNCDKKWCISFNSSHVAGVSKDCRFMCVLWFTYYSFVYLHCSCCIFYVFQVCVLLCMYILNYFCSFLF